MRRNERGGALLAVVVVTIAITGLSAAFFTLTMFEVGKSTDAMVDQQAYLMARSGIYWITMDVNATTPTATLNILTNPTLALTNMSMSGGTWNANLENLELNGVDDNGNGQIDEQAESFIRVECSATVQGRTITLRSFLTQDSLNWPDFGFFAGNADNDPSYVMKFGGSGSDADTISASIYSGGGIQIDDDAVITPGSQGIQTVEGVSGSGTIPPNTTTSPIPPPTMPDYEAMIAAGDPSIIDVRAQFEAFGFNGANPWGGNGTMLPQNMDGHIFTMNNSDRNGINNRLDGDVFYLEDPYQTVKSDPTQNMIDPPIIQLTTNNVILYIGPDPVTGKPSHLVLEAWPTFSQYIVGPNGESVNATIVANYIELGDSLGVKGHEDGTGALGLIAVEAPGHESTTGDIYYGSESGTLRYIQGVMMYAQNNSYNHNVDNTSEIHFKGSFAAGKKVENGLHENGADVPFDFEHYQAVSNGTVSLPGLPSTPPGDGKRFVRTIEKISNP